MEIITLKKKSITDFSRERNRLLKRARDEWVFFLDSDERMSKDLEAEIVELLSSRTGDNYQGFYIARKNYFLGKYVGTDKILRLGRKTAGRWRRAVHEKWIIKGRIGELKDPLIHNTAKSVRDMVVKVNFYSTLHAKANEAEGKTAGLFKIVFYPKLKFLQSMLTGRGVVFSILQAFHSFLGWSKLWLSQNA